MSVAEPVVAPDNNLSFRASEIEGFRQLNAVCKKMELNLSVENGKQFLEGISGQLPNVSGITPILEACLSHRVSRVLLYSDNLGEEFFDLSSGMAGEMLQKFRNYGVRIAVVRSPGVQLSSKFGAVMAEENLGPYFRLFDSRNTAQQWLCSE